MTDTSAHETVKAINELLRLGFTEKDIAEICTIPDCYCDGTPHD
jgi:hypothetical protein